MRTLTPITLLSMVLLPACAAKSRPGPDTDISSKKKTSLPPLVPGANNITSATHLPQCDSLSNCDAEPNTSPQTSNQSSDSNKPATPLKAHPPLIAGRSIALGNNGVTVALKPDASATAVDSKALQVTPGHSYLVLEDVRLNGSPSLTYNIFLIGKANSERSSYIGTLSYFGVGLTDHAGHGDPNSLGTIVYNVSRNLAELGISAASDVNVRFEPTNLLVNKKIKPQREDDGVTVGDIRLETSEIAPSK